MVSSVRGALPDVHASIIDVSANRATLDLSGPGRANVLSQGCSIDLDHRSGSWRTGMCAQTLLARVPVILHERETGTRVFVRPSYLAYLTAWFDDAVR
jgi:sarcosine oxidase subunit gamma